MNNRQYTVITPEIAKAVFDSADLSSSKTASLLNLSFETVKKLKARIRNGLTYQEWLSRYESKRLVRSASFMTEEEINSLNISASTKIRLRRKFGYEVKDTCSENWVTKFIRENHSTMTAKQIAEVTGILETSVRCRAKKYGLELKREHIAPKLGKIEKFVIENAGRMTQKKVSEAIGASYEYVGRAARKHGVKFKNTEREAMLKVIKKRKKKLPAKQLKMDTAQNPEQLTIKRAEKMKRVGIGYRTIEVEVPYDATPEFIAHKVQKARNLYMNR